MQWFHSMRNNAANPFHHNPMTMNFSHNSVYKLKLKWFKNYSAQSNLDLNYYTRERAFCYKHGFVEADYSVW